MSRVSWDALGLWITPGLLSSSILCGVLFSVSSRQGILVLTRPSMWTNDAGRFLWHWWVRRKRLNSNWSAGMPSGISQSEFRRLIVTVLCVIFVYLPLSLIPLVAFLKTPKVPFSEARIHGP